VFSQHSLKIGGVWINFPRLFAFALAYGAGFYVVHPKGFGADPLNICAVSLGKRPFDRSSIAAHAQPTGFALFLLPILF
jgi:hypothetical protein